MFDNPSSANESVPPVRKDHHLERAATESHRMSRRRPVLRTVLVYGPLTVLFALVLALSWLRWDAGRERGEWFDARKGTLQSAEITASGRVGRDGHRIESVHLTSSTGLEISFRVLRPDAEAPPRPVLIVLGGHRTGSKAVTLFEEVGRLAFVALDYPYDGPASVSGLGELATIVPQIREALLDIPPAISLTVDWLRGQEWADGDEIAMAGVSLGVPFAATAAARDERLSGLMLAHGAADNRMWLELNLTRGFETEWLRAPTATLMYWLAYGPLFDTTEHVAAVSPRPVVIVGARGDHRTPEAQTRALYAAARDPKRLYWTEGGHVDPARREVIEDLVRIANEEMPFSRRRTSAERP
jgi:hypothetical protein